jgi:hypothetical protein
VLQQLLGHILFTSKVAQLNTWNPVRARFFREIKKAQVVAMISGTAKYPTSDRLHLRFTLSSNKLFGTAASDMRHSQLCYY